MTWIVSRLSIVGVKGVLDRAGDFKLAKGRSPRSVAVYAPNACGKSGYADAVEYLFSEDGGVAHLGKGGADSERGGKHAIPHVLAEEKGIEPRVSMTLINSESGESVQATRAVTTGRIDGMPSELHPIVCVAPAHRILRQHDLRRFVVDMTPGEKYTELSRWLGLTRLEQILRHLKTTSNALESTDLDREIEERVQDVTTHTSRSVTKYDEHAVLHWCASETERHLGESLAIDSLDDINKAIQALKQRRDQTILSSGAAESYQAKLNLDQIAADLVSQDSQLEVCNAALTSAMEAERQVERVRAAAENSVFQEVWNAAKEVLESRSTDRCPVCSTSWESTQVGSQKGAILQITRSLAELTKLDAALKKQRKATDRLKETFKDLDALLTKMPTEAEKLSLGGIEDQATILAETARALSTTNRLPSQIQSECRDLSSLTMAHLSLTSP